MPLLGPAAAQRALGAVRSARAVYSSVAGGIVTDWEGGPAHQGGRCLAAANPALHRAALDLLRDTPTA